MRAKPKRTRLPIKKWRAAAADLRAFAITIKNPETQARARRLAADYDELADEAEFPNEKSVVVQGYSGFRR